MFAANNLLLTGSTGSGYQISRSVRFRASATAYFNRTYGVATNNQKGTISVWLKQGLLNQRNTIFANSAGSIGVLIGATAGACNLQLLGSGLAGNGTTQIFRDPSAWFHLVIAVDTTQATGSDRIKAYINNTAITLPDTATQNAAFFTDSIVYRIGNYANSSGFYYDGYMAEFYFVDGQQLTPSSFGATDASTGVWNPIAYTGTYGNNGYYLPFSLNTGSTYSGSFNGSSQYLVSPSNAAFAFGTGDFTVEAWIKPTALTNFYTIFGTRNTSNSSTAFTLTMDASGTVGVYTSSFSPITAATITAGVWSHVAVTRSGTTARIFVDGILSASATLSNNFTDQVFTIGGPVGGGSQFFAGEISNLRVVKGTAVYTSNFAVPTSALTAISGTSLLTLQNATIVDNSTNAFSLTNNGTVVTATTTPFANPTIGADSSGNLNNWLPVNINASTTGTTYDSMVDSPTNYGVDTGVGGEVRGSYCTLNPLNSYSSITLQNGLLRYTTTQTGLNILAMATMGFSSGKWYWEVTATTVGTDNGATGIMKTSFNGQTGGTYPGYETQSVGYHTDGGKSVNGPNSLYGASYTSGDVIGIGVDCGAGTIVFYKNGVSQGVINAGINYEWTPAQGGYNLSTPPVRDMNFGQQPFVYTNPGVNRPASDYKALCTQNLPTLTISNGANYFAATTYTGTGNSSGDTLAVTNTVNGTSFAPDFVWVKDRITAGTNNVLTNSVAGAGLELYSNTQDAESSANEISALNNNGFTVRRGTYPAGTNTNVSGINYIGWNWKGGGTAVTNNNGTIASQVSANPTAGVSIVSYSGNSTAGATVGHGLGVAPSMIIVKERSPDTNYNWFVYHTSIGNTAYLLLNTVNPSSSGVSAWNNTTPTSSVFTLGSYTELNKSTAPFIAYCFAPVAGYSAFGSYTGNGSTSGPFVYLGFRPRWFMSKRTDSTGSWLVVDSARNPYNVVNSYLVPNTSAEEGTAVWGDFLSNGVKLRGSTHNGSGETYIYAAFAENPFKIARAR